jgi:hypothetical protein
MIASAIVQTILLLSSGAFNVLLNPGSLSVEKQLFVSSVVLMIGFAQGFLMITIKVLIRLLTGFNIRFGTTYLFAPLANAMRNSVNDRPGETDVNTPVVTKIRNDNTKTPSRETAYDGFDSEDEEFAPTASHFMPELEVALDERRNVYTDIYLLGIATFTTTYCIDTVSPAPTTAFISGLLIMSIAQSANILVILTRTTSGYIGGEDGRALRVKRLLTVTSCIFASGAFIMFSIGLVNSREDISSINTIFDVTFSIVLPLIAPWLLVTVSPKQQPLRTLFECTPFVFTISFSFVLFFLATRGQISTIVHELTTTSGNITKNTTTTTLGINIAEFEVHTNANASLHFNMDMFSTTSVDNAGNIPMLMLAPLIKIPTIVVVLANVINRSNLVVITALMVTMTLREINTDDISTSTHRAYCVALVLSIISLLFNLVKYLKIPAWVTEMRNRHVHSSPKDIDLGMDEMRPVA